MHAGDLRLGYRLNSLLFNLSAKVRRKNLLEDILLNLVGKFSANYGLRNLAGAKAGNTGHAAVLLHHAGEGFADFIGRDFDVHLASALRIERGAVIVRMCVVVLMLVRRVRGSFGQGICISDSVARVDSCAPVSVGCWVSSPACGVVVDSVGLKGCMPSRKRACHPPIRLNNEPWQVAATDRFARSERMTFLRSMVGGYVQWVKPEGAIQ